MRSSPFIFGCVFALASCADFVKTTYRLPESSPRHLMLSSASNPEVTPDNVTTSPSTSPPKKLSRRLTKLAKAEEKAEKTEQLTETMSHGESSLEAAVMPNTALAVGDEPPSQQHYGFIPQPILQMQAGTGELFVKVTDIQRLALHTPVAVPSPSGNDLANPADLQVELSQAQTTLLEQSEKISTLTAEVAAMTLERNKSQQIALEANNESISAAVAHTTVISMFEKSSMEYEVTAMEEEKAAAQAQFEYKQMTTELQVLGMELEKSEKESDHHQLLEINIQNTNALLRTELAELSSKLKHISMVVGTSAEVSSSSSAS